MKKYIIYIIFLFSSFIGAPSVIAQHCPYDFLGLVVLYIHSEDNSEVIPDLRITLLDSNNTIINDPYYEEPFEFIQNSLNSRNVGPLDNNHSNHHKKRFPFAKNNYVLLCMADFDLNGCKVEIIDRKGLFGDTIIDISNAVVYPLCTVYDYEEYPKRPTPSSGTFNYKPYEITLEKK